MRPELFQIFGVTFYAYRTLLAVAFVVCTLLAVRESKRRGDTPPLTPTLGIWALLGALLGARIFHTLQYGRPQDWWRALILWDGGLVFYGGLIGGVAAVAVCLRVQGVPFLRAADVMAPYVALGEAITRAGCFLNGCCFGVSCSYPWAVQFPPGSVAYQAHLDRHWITQSDAYSLAIHPTQLYMAGGLLAGFALLKWRLGRKSWDGSVVCDYLLSYGILRFLVEILRGDSARSIAGMTVSQSISVVLVAVAAGVSVYRWQAGAHANT